MNEADVVVFPLTHSSHTARKRHNTRQTERRADNGQTDGYLPQRWIRK